MTIYLIRQIISVYVSALIVVSVVNLVRCNCECIDPFPFHVIIAVRHCGMNVIWPFTCLYCRHIDVNTITF